MRDYRNIVWLLVFSIHSSLLWGAEGVDDKLAWLFVKRAVKHLAPDEGQWNLKSTGSQDILMSIRRGSEARWLIAMLSPPGVAGRKVLLKKDSAWVFDSMIKKSMSVPLRDLPHQDLLALLFIADASFWFDLVKAEKDAMGVLTVEMHRLNRDCPLAKIIMRIQQKGSVPLGYDLIHDGQPPQTFVVETFDPKDELKSRRIHRSEGSDKMLWFELSQFEPKSLPDMVFSQHFLQK